MPRWLGALKSGSHLQRTLYLAPLSGTSKLKHQLYSGIKENLNFWFAKELECGGI